ncbi:HNH endonuclease family protein [Streptomyces termitum]|uniref:Lipoprotein n=1 Tax=Streptomyces termitum TaxID=67368 RepID=A0A918T5A6_9ACTN|nr:lipoprotein [Streptomyces termitum]
MSIRRKLSAAVGLAGLVLLAGCSSPGGSSSAASGTDPFDNPNGVRAGLAPVTARAEREKARKLIDGLTVKGRGTKTGYDRDEFGYAWMDKVDGVPFARNGCDTRNDMLRRDGRDLSYRAGSNCVVVAMKLPDPYTGTTIDWTKEKASAVQIDHVVPLSYSWQMGSSRWSKGKRQQLANDPLNLLPVEGRANSAKGDSGPATWLPPSKDIRCAYAVRFAQVAAKYALPVTAPDKKAMLEQCG